MAKTAILSQFQAFFVLHPFKYLYICSVISDGDMLYAGTGANLALAAAPVYFEANGA